MSGDYYIVKLLHWVLGAGSLRRVALLKTPRPASDRRAPSVRCDGPSG